MSSRTIFAPYPKGALLYDDDFKCYIFITLRDINFFHRPFVDLPIVKSVKACKGILEDFDQVVSITRF